MGPGASDHGDVHAPGGQGLGQFQADVAGPDDHRPARPVPLQHRPQGQAVVEGLHPVDTGRIDPGQWRAGRGGPGGDHELIETLPGLPAGGQVAHEHGAAVQVDLQDLVTGAGVDGVVVAELLRGTGDQLRGVGDVLADEVRDPAGRIRGVVAPLEGHDLQLVLGQLAAGGGGRAHPRGVPTDDDQPLGHDFPFRYSAC